MDLVMDGAHWGGSTVPSPDAFHVPSPVWRSLAMLQKILLIYVQICTHFGAVWQHLSNFWQRWKDTLAPEFFLPQDRVLICGRVAITLDQTPKVCLW